MEYTIILIANFRRVLNVVYFLLGNSPTSEFCMPMFRNTLSVPSSYLPAYEDGTERAFRNVGIQNSDAGELPRKSIQNTIICLVRSCQSQRNISCQPFLSTFATCPQLLLTSRGHLSICYLKIRYAVVTRGYLTL